MYGLPDSAVIGTIKHMRGHRHSHTTDGWDDLIMLLNAVRYFRARRRVQKKREAYFKKHGYYRQ